MSTYNRVRQLFVREERGAVIIIVAILLFFVLIGMVAISVDVGYLYLQRRHQQTTADSAALAAAWHLPWNGSEGGSIVSTAEKYIEENNMDKATGTVTPYNGDDDKVLVEIEETYSLFFAQAPPIFTPDAEVYAMAVATKEYTFVDILPFMVIDYEDYDFLPEDEEWEDWEASDLYNFLQGIGYDDRPLDEGVTVYTWTNQNHGNWGLVNMSHFSDQVDSKSSISGPDLQVILKHGLDKPFCKDPNLLRSREAGKVSSIDTNVPSSRDGIKLSDLLVDDEKSFFIILISPRRAAEEFQGNHTAFTLDEFLIARVRPLTLNGDRLEGTIRDVWKSSECDQIPKEYKKWFPVLIK